MSTCPICGKDKVFCTANTNMNEFYRHALYQGVAYGNIEIVGFEDNGVKFLDSVHKEQRPKTEENKRGKP